MRSQIDSSPAAKCLEKNLSLEIKNLKAILRTKAVVEKGIDQLYRIFTVAS